MSNHAWNLQVIPRLASSAVFFVLVLGCSRTPADPDLLTLLSSDQYDSVRKRVLKGEDVNRPGKATVVNLRNESEDMQSATPLYVAVTKGSEDMVSFLLSHGADPNVPVDKSYTSLMYACKSGNLAIAERLVKSGANIEATNDSGGSPLLGAVFDGHPEVVEMLLTNKANPNPKDASPNPLQTALVAPYQGKVTKPSDFERRVFTARYVRTVALLLRAGADPNQPGDFGPSPLSMAIRTGPIEVIQMLLDAGARVHGNTVSESPEILSAQVDRKDVAALLSKYWKKSH